jgi:4-hydroxy-tetrahydrodipicolinate reductase
MTDGVNITVLGPTGRLGQAICKAILDSEDCALVGAVVRAESPRAGHDLGDLLDRPRLGVMAEAELEAAIADADLVIDASLPSMTVAAAQRLAALKGPALITGVTGLTADQDERLDAAAKQIPLLRAGNFSLGVAVAESLVAQAAALSARDWDIEIHETHHRMKTDAPSGTALMLGRAAAKKRGITLEEAGVWSRRGSTGPRELGTIGFSVNRGGSIVGEHAVRFIAELEELTISHKAYDRAIFAKGALEAARWMANGGKGRPIGAYSMQNVIGG